MKKIILAQIILIMMGIGIRANAQQTVIIQNNNSSNTNSTYSTCDFKINGICSNQDIGGVELSQIDCYDKCNIMRGDVCLSSTKYCSLQATNYNSSTVTLLVKLIIPINRDGDTKERIYTTILKPNESKIVTNGNQFNFSRIEIYSITRKLQ